MQDVIRLTRDLELLSRDHPLETMQQPSQQICGRRARDPFGCKDRDVQRSPSNGRRAPQLQAGSSEANPQPAVAEVAAELAEVRGDRPATRFLYFFIQLTYRPGLQSGEMLCPRLAMRVLLSEAALN